jgi:hypothetical protein
VTNAFNPASAFDDLEDAAFWADEPSENIIPFGTREAVVTEMPPGGGYKQRCDKCQGSGKFRGRNGRIFGDCFACKGEGFLTFKTSPQERSTARGQSAARKAAILAQWLEANVDVVAWVKRRSTGDRPFDFAVELAGKLQQYGTLTDGAVAAVKRMIARDAERAAERAQAQPAKPAVDTGRVEAAFAKAVAVAKAEAQARVGGEADRATFKAPKLRLGEFFITLAPMHGRNAGALYVKRTTDREYLGKIAGGQFSKSFVCTPAEQAAVVETCADPEAAAVAYGRLHSQCAICGRGLDNYESIERGIGPICAKKWGW